MSRKLLYLCVGITMLCSCRYDPHHDLYLKSTPPKDQICGTWVIDSERTTWDKVRNGGVDSEAGYLQVTAEGRFLVEDLPDFSVNASTFPCHSGSGVWWTDINTQGFAYLWLHFEMVDGEPNEDKCESAFFRREGQDYFLHIIVDDPDTGDALVMRKVEAAK